MTSHVSVWMLHINVSVCGRADLKGSSNTRKLYLSFTIFFPVLPNPIQQNKEIIVHRTPHPPHPGQPLEGWPAEPGELDALRPGCGKWLFSFSHLGLVATPRSDLSSTYGVVAPSHAGGQSLQREITLFSAGLSNLVIRAEFQQVLLCPSLPEVLDDLLLESEFLCQTFGQGRLGSGRDRV